MKSELIPPLPKALTAIAVLMMATLFIAMLFALAGCKPLKLDDPMVKASNALTAAQIHGDEALDQMKLIRVAGDNKVRVGFAISSLLKQKDDHAAIAKANADEAKVSAQKDTDLKTARDDLKTLQDNRGVKFILWVEWLWKWTKVAVVVIAIVGVLCELYGTFGGNKAAAGIALAIAKWIWGIASFGFSAFLAKLQRLRINKNYVPLEQHTAAVAAAASGAQG